MRDERHETQYLDCGVNQNVVGFYCAGLDSSTFRVFPIDGAWPVDSNSDAIVLDVVVSNDGHSWGVVTGKGSGFSAAGYQEIDHGKNAWVGLMVHDPTPDTVSTPPRQVQVDWVGLRIY